MVSPIALEIATMNAAVIPEIAAGTTTQIAVSSFVDPSPY
jgi:hypothetical protein